MIVEPTQVSRLLDLLKEYTKKLDGMAAVRGECENGQRVFSESKPEIWQHAQYEYLMHIESAIQNLLRTSSQLIEHGGISDIDRAAIQVRMYDLEATLRKANLLVRHPY